MLIFKNYIRISKSYLSLILIYTVIFVGIAAMASLSGNQSSSTFEVSEAKIAIINHDQDTPLVKSFIDYVKTNAEYVELKNDEDTLRDALFFRKAEFIMTIPKNFTEDFMAGNDVKILTKDVPDSSGAMYSKTLLNKYLNTAKLYLKTDISSSDMLKNIQQDLSIHTDVQLLNQNQNSEIENVAIFYNFANYTLLSITIAVITMIMISFRDEKIRRRNVISSTSYKSLNRQLLLGNMVISFGVWLLYVLCSVALYSDVIFNLSGLLIIFNSFIFMIFVLIFSFFVTTLTQSRELASGISTVVGLGTSFIAGAFVPQGLLSPFVVNLSKLTPSYWYISNNNQIAKLSSFNMSDLQPVFFNIVIMLGFSILFYLLIQVVSRYKTRRI